MHERAVHATNVFHYHHVIKAMHVAEFDPTLLGRWELDETAYSKFEGSRAVPTCVGSLVARRRTRDLTEDVSVSGLGLAQLVAPLMARAPMIGMSGWQYRAVTRRYAARAASVAHGARLVHPIEGLAHRLPDIDRKRLALVLERRNFHHAVFEQDIEAYGGFPSAVRRDPIGNLLDYEYEIANKVVVSSDVARASFINRGINPDKVVTIPLPIAPAITSRNGVGSREFDSSQLLYVGRGEVYKGLDVAVEAVRLLGRPHRLIVAGPAPRRVQEWLKKKEHVEYLGICGRTTLENLYRSSRCLLLPSVESFGLVSFDATRLGLPVICRETTGASQYLPPETVTVVQGRRPEVWAETIAKYEAVGIGARSDASTDESSVVNRLASVYEALVGLME